MTAAAVPSLLICKRSRATTAISKAAAERPSRWKICGALTRSKESGTRSRSRCRMVNSPPCLSVPWFSSTRLARSSSSAGGQKLRQESCADLLQSSNPDGPGHAPLENTPHLPRSYPGHPRCCKVSDPAHRVGCGHALNAWS